MESIGVIFVFATLFCNAVALLVQPEPQPQDSFAKHEGHPFVSFINHYGRVYHHGTREYEERLDIFSRRVAEVQAHNSQANRRWTAGINALSDRTDAELAQLRGWKGGAVPGNKRKASAARAGATFLKQASKALVLPRDFTNWTRLESIMAIRDQGACGSCWAVAAGTVLDSNSEIHAPAARRSFSVQDMVSCVPNPRSCGGTGGCEGATVELAFDYAINYGLATTEEVPYHGNTGTCKNSNNAGAVSLASGIDNIDVATPGVHYAATKPAAAVGMKAWERLPENAYEPMLRAVYEHGPVAVSVSASTWSFYAAGVFDSCQKDAVIDHAVTMIGFGEESLTKYWLVQNSWGNSWGESGRIRILRHDGEDQHCGTDRQPEVGTGCKGGPAEVRVCGMCGILYDSVVPHFK